MKKITKTFIIIIVIISLIIPENVRAMSDNKILDGSIERENMDEMANGMSDNTTNSLLDSGEADLYPAKFGEKENTYQVKKQTSVTRETENIGGTIGAALAMAVTLIPAAMNSVATLIITGELPVKKTNSAVKRITIQDIIFNKYAIFDINFFDSATNNKSQKRISSDTSEDFQQGMTDGARMWYGTFRKLAIVLSLLVLIYIGLRMGLSTVGEEQGKYKKMLISWFQGFAIIFFIHYIVIFALWISNTLMQIVPEPTTNLEEYILFGDEEEEKNNSENNNNQNSNNDGEEEENKQKYKGLENLIFDGAKGWNLVWYCIMYIIFVYFQLKFAVKYLYRVINVYFLMVIGPIITMMFSIDKVKDGSAQTFEKWIKELMVNIFIQPIHAILYVIFIASAGEIAKVAPLLAIIFFAGISRGEKIVKDIFDIRNMTTIKSLGTHGHA